MWAPDWVDSAHEILKRQQQHYLVVAALLAVLLFGLGAALAPPYIPTPYQLPPPPRGR